MMSFYEWATLGLSLLLLVGVLAVWGFVIVDNANNDGEF